MDTKDRKIGKFTGTHEAEIALERMVNTVNDGFAGGRISRHDLLSWIVLNFERQWLQQSLGALRADHFDQLAYLETVLADAKRARKEGQPVPDLSIALAQWVPG